MRVERRIDVVPDVPVTDEEVLSDREIVHFVDALEGPSGVATVVERKAEE
jgi:hypothetical protein